MRVMTKYVKEGDIGICSTSVADNERVNIYFKGYI